MKHRIRSEREFQLVYRKGRRIASERLQIHVLAGPPQGLAYAVVVSNNTTPLATKRNTVRRRIRSILESERENLFGTTIIVSVKKDISETHFQGLKQELLLLLARATTPGSPRIS